MKRLNFLLTLTFVIFSYTCSALESENFFGPKSTNFILKALGNKRLKKILSKRNFEFGPYQIGPGQPVLAKILIKISKKTIFINGKEYRKETLELGHRIGGFYYLGASAYSYKSIEVVYQEKQSPAQKELMLNNIIKGSYEDIHYETITFQQYKGKDLIAGVTSPKYILSFYNLAVRLNLIKKSIWKIHLDKSDKPFAEIGISKNITTQFRFFSEFFGLDQNHFTNIYEGVNHKTFIINKDIPSISTLLKLFTEKNINLQAISEKNKYEDNEYINKEDLIRLKKFSLFGLINKKIKGLSRKSSSGNSKSKISLQNYQLESFYIASKWTNFFRKEKHSLYIGAYSDINGCKLLINASVMDGHVTKRERKKYSTNYGLNILLNSNDKVEINRQIIVKLKKETEAHLLNCSLVKISTVIKNLKKLTKKSLHSYNLINLLNYLDEYQDINYKITDNVTVSKDVKLTTITNPNETTISMSSPLISDYISNY